MQINQTISTAFFILMCSFALFVSQARAETLNDEPKDLASSLHLKAGGLSVEKQTTDGVNEAEKASRRVIVPLTGGLSAFFDCDLPLGANPTSPEANGKKVSFRPLFGFHIPL